jgi:hypothetical protein
MTKSIVLTLSTVFLGLVYCLATNSSAISQGFSKCPNGYGRLCAELSRPRGGAIGSESGTGGKFTEPSRGDQLQNKDFYVNRPANSMDDDR